MRYFFAFFFLVIMTLNVTLPLVERLQLGDMYELVKGNPGDTDEDGQKETEKEKEKEKETYSYANHQDINLNAFYLDLFRKPMFDKYDFPVSEHYLSTPERPPQG